MLGEIGKTQSGGTPSSKHPEYFQGVIPWIGTTALNGRRIDESAAVKMITEEAVANSATKLVPANSIMVGIRVGVGKVAINSVPMCTSQDIVSILGVDETVWNKEYIVLALRFLAPVLAARAQGATITGISSKTLKEITIPVVSLDRQNVIVGQLRGIEEQIDIACRQVEQLDFLVKSQFVEMFGDIDSSPFDVVTIQDVCEPIKDGTHKTPTYASGPEDGVIFLSSKDVTSGKIDWDHTKFIVPELHDELRKRVSPKLGDVLLAKNGTTGICAVVDRDVVFDIYVTLALLRPVNGVNPIFLWAAVNADRTKEQFNRRLKGIGVPNLHLKEIKETRIVLPPSELQNQFAGFVQRVDKSKSIAQKQIEKLQLLYDSLAQEYFGD